MTYFIDSNIFLRTLIKEDEKTFKECYQFLNLIQSKKIKAFTSSLILAEISWVLGGFYKFKKLEVVNALQSIINLRGLKITDKMDPRAAIEIFQRFNIKFVDALIASTPKIFRKEMIIVSYDRDFDKLGVIRKKPRDIKC